MNKEKYVSVIEKALVGHVSPQELQDTVAYYRDYIEMEIRKGKTEQEVLDELGNPRLLAKTIIMAKEHKMEAAQGESASGADSTHESKQSSGFNIPLPILILIIVLFLMMIFSAIVSVLRFLMPIVVPIAAILIIISFVKKWKK